MDKISLRAPAKINLYLKVLGKREDGYHEIESLMQAVDLYDDIIIEKSDKMELRCDDPLIPSDENNLALRAVMEFKKSLEFPDIKISLRKNIPVGAGLGGGSSDAAFILRGICRLFNLDIDKSELIQTAAEIGSDVPFFLSTGQSICRGRGEKITPVNLPVDYRVALIVPSTQISTAKVYGRLKNALTKKSDTFLFQKEISISSFYRLFNLFANDLEEAALVDLPDLPEIKKLLTGSGCEYAAMTGSGSAVFGLYTGRDHEIPELESKLKPDYRLIWCSPILLPPIYAD